MSHRNSADLDAALNGLTFAVRQAALERIAVASWLDGRDAAVEETTAALRAAPTDTALRARITEIADALDANDGMTGPGYGEFADDLRRALHPAPATPQEPPA